MKHRPRIFILLTALFLTALLSLTVQTKAEGMISIDTEKKYNGMSASFAKGYAPTVKKDTMLLVVPFLTNVPLENDSLIVGVSFEREENSPFQFNNYQKTVKKSGKGVYLYQCRIKLQKDRINGQYPLHLTVRAQTASSSEDTSFPSETDVLSEDSPLPSGEIIQQDFTVYVEITDGIQTYSAKAEPELPDIEEEPASESSPLPSDNQEELIRQPKVMLTKSVLHGEIPSGDTSLPDGNTGEIPSGDTSLPAGSSAFWTVAAKNCSSSQPMENVKVTLLSDAESIVFEKNAWYFEQINAGTTIELSQTITANKKALAETIPIQFQFDYEDKNGNPYNVTETAHLSIIAVQQAELVDLFFPESIYESDTNSLTFQVQNTGFCMIYNARVRIEGQGLFPEREMFLGNIEAGSSADGEIPVFAGTLNMDETGAVLDETAEKYGITSAKVFFSYEDDQGNVKEQEVQLQTAIQKPQTIELTIENEEPETNQWWITIVFFIVLALALLNIWLYLRMKYYQNRRKDTYERT